MKAKDWPFQMLIFVKNLFESPLFASLFLIAVVTFVLLLIMISAARKEKFSDRDHLVFTFVVALFSIIISVGLTWFSAKIANQNEQTKLANSAMRHLELIRRSADKLSLSIGQVTANSTTYSSSEDSVYIRSKISGLVSQVQAFEDGVDTAIGDWENILSPDATHRLPQYSRVSDLENRVSTVEREVENLRANSQKKRQ